MKNHTNAPHSSEHSYVFVSGFLITQAFPFEAQRRRAGEPLSRRDVMDRHQQHSAVETSLQPATWAQPPRGLKPRLPPPPPLHGPGWLRSPDPMQQDNRCLCRIWLLLIKNRRRLKDFWGKEEASGNVTSVEQVTIYS